MKLMTKAIEARFKQLGSQEDKGDEAIVVCKFFDPVGSWSWFATEWNPDTREFFGYVHGLEDEWGPFSLGELESIRRPLGLGIERDRWWKEMTIGEVQAKNCFV